MKKEDACVAQPGCYGPKQVCLEERLNLFHLKHTAREERRDVHGAEGSMQSKWQQDSRLWEYSRERKIGFVLTSCPAGWCFLHRSQLPSAVLCSGENQMVKIAKPLWCAYSMLRQSYLTSSGDRHRSYSCSMDRDYLVIVSEAVESRKGHIALMVNYPSGCIYGSHIIYKISHSHGSAFGWTDCTYKILLAWPSSPGCRNTTFSAWIWLVSQWISSDR